MIYEGGITINKRLRNSSAEEIMTMLLEASDENAESKEHGGGGRIVWSVRYALEGEEDNVSLAGPFQANQPHYHHHNNGGGAGGNGHSSDRKKLQAHLEIQKDDIQAVLPISKVIRACALRLLAFTTGFTNQPFGAFFFFLMNNKKYVCGLESLKGTLPD